jgi:hypothetical protein
MRTLKLIVQADTARCLTNEPHFNIQAQVVLLDVEISTQKAPTLFLALAFIIS